MKKRRYIKFVGNSFTKVRRYTNIYAKSLPINVCSTTVPHSDLLALKGHNHRDSTLGHERHRMFD